MMTIKSFLWMLAALLFFSWKLMGCQKKGKDRPKKGTLTDPTSGVKAPLPQGTPAAAASAPTPTASGGTPVAVAAPTTPAVPANQTLQRQFKLRLLLLPLRFLRKTRLRTSNSMRM
uniref:Uncharacterized protein n=1 Tax=Ditylenchus dipsaci TaxID=166011 RepID=A0A915E8B7_9BILA